MTRRLGLLLMFVCVVGASPTLAERRVALVVGNSAYKTAPLANPVNDARLVEVALRQAQFQSVEARSDLGIMAFRQALRRFQLQADGAEVAFLYFAGHGVEAGGANWLIPTDGELAAVRDLEYEAIRLDLALEALRGARMRILVLDACRNNPFGRNWRSGSREYSRGLRRQEADDVLVLFAAAPGQTASDGTDGNSPFATALAKWLPEPGLPVQLLGGKVRDDVLSKTGNMQRPYVSASITGEPFYLVPASIAPPVPPPLSPPPPAISQRAIEAERFWETNVKNSREPAVLEAFCLRYGDTFHCDLAKTRLAELRRELEINQQEKVRREEAQRRAEAERQALLREQDERKRILQSENSNSFFDGHWYSPEWKYGYRLRNGVGTATSTNSPNFQVGQVIIKIHAVAPRTFEGEQVYKDGRWYKIKGTLRADGRIYIDGERNVSWYMTRME